MKKTVKKTTKRLLIALILGAFIFFVNYFFVNYTIVVPVKNRFLVQNKNWLENIDLVQNKNWLENIDSVVIGEQMRATTSFLYPLVSIAFAKRPAEFILCLYGFAEDNILYIEKAHLAWLKVTGRMKKGFDSIVYSETKGCDSFAFASGAGKYPKIIPWVGVAHSHVGGKEPCQPSTPLTNGANMPNDLNFFLSLDHPHRFMIIVCGPSKFGVVLRAEPFKAKIYEYEDSSVFKDITG